MKKLILIVILALAALQLPAQEYKYSLSRGNSTGEVIYRASKEGGITSLFIQIEEQKSYHKIDAQNRNTYWRCVDPGKNMDIEIVLENGIYHITGTNNGKKIDRTEKSKGCPWYQNLAYLSGTVVPETGNVKYECFQPGAFSLHQMEAEIVSKESDSERTCVRAHPAGISSKIFHADYFFSPKTRKLVGYKCAEGMPGTPVTTWSLIK